MSEKSFVRGNERVDRWMARPGMAEAVAKLGAEADELNRTYSMSLAMIRKAGKRTQVEIAKELQVSQGAVSQLESRGEMLLSILRNYLVATGANDPRIVVTVNGQEITLDLAAIRVE